MATYPEYTHYRPKDDLDEVIGAIDPRITPPDIEGPFYKAGAPDLPDGMMVPNGTLYLHGSVRDPEGNDIEGAVLDFWQADEKGEYDNVGYKLRGKVVNTIKDHYLCSWRLTTIRPGDYKITDNPPDFRCAHIHVKVTAPGFKPLTTQLYFNDDAYNATDHWFDPRRVIGDEGQFDFVLERE